MSPIARISWVVSCRSGSEPDDPEAHDDATLAVEKAYAWVPGLREHEFVGTESRLNTVFDLLRRIAFGTETDPDARLPELGKRRLEIDAEIAAVEAGDLPVLEPAVPLPTRTLQHDPQP
jgi:hypothetical protein